MKIPYEKPMMAIERYALTQSIADCAKKIGFMDSACVLKDPDSTGEMKDLAYDNGFLAGYCSDPVEGGQDDSDGVCYHTLTTIAFNS